MSYMSTKPEYDSHFVAQIMRGTENTDVRKFQSSIRAESNTIMKYSLSLSACTYIANCRTERELLGVIIGMGGI